MILFCFFVPPPPSLPVAKRRGNLRALAVLQTDEGHRAPLGAGDDEPLESNEKNGIINAESGAVL